MAYACRAAAKSELRQHRAAIDDCDKALQWQSLPGTYYIRGISNFQLRMPREAIRDLDKAIELKPDYAEAYAWRGVAKDELNKDNEKDKKKDSLNDFEKAISLNCTNSPDIGLAYFFRGIDKLFRVFSKRESGYADLDKAVALNPALTEAVEGTKRNYSEGKKQFFINLGTSIVEQIADNAAETGGEKLGKSIGNMF
jgi:tetratricopeptide (TPR) repeat protein